MREPGDAEPKAGDVRSETVTWGSADSNLIRTAMIEAAVHYRSLTQIDARQPAAGTGLNERSRRVLCSHVIQRRVGNRSNRRKSRAIKRRAKPRTLLKTARAQARLECERYE